MLTEQQKQFLDEQYDNNHLLTAPTNWARQGFAWTRDMTEYLRKLKAKSLKEAIRHKQENPIDVHAAAARGFGPAQRDYVRGTK